LVFSTLHTNDAAGTYPRLIDLGVNAKVITSAINISMAQRLVRKLCDNCKLKSLDTSKERVIIEKVLATIQDKSYLENVDLNNIYAPKGCEVCNSTGFKGRIGIYEAIISDQAIEKVVNENPSEREINKAAESQNILNMKQDGIIKVLQGITSIDELQRVIDLEK
jgi:type IV pilus assembly protein PilB